MAHKILVIDDERVSLSLVKFGLAANHYDVSTAMDGDVGLEMVRSENPDLIVLDIGMPKLNGYEFMQELKNLEGHEHTPVIILTANETMEDVFKLEGSLEYFVKPVDIAKLVARIKDCLGTPE
ncbi:MAG: response regulator [Candidatus Omnitrophica bacterium]|nr:response regulator [Candidatus Omnitrophota bacterium]